MRGGSGGGAALSERWGRGRGCIGQGVGQREGLHWVRGGAWGGAALVHSDLSVAPE